MLAERCIAAMYGTLKAKATRGPGATVAFDLDVRAAGLRRSYPMSAIEELTPARIRPHPVRSTTTPPTLMLVESLWRDVLLLHRNPWSTASRRLEAASGRPY